MGRTFPSVRQEAKGTAERWARCARALKTEDQKYGEELVRIAKRHSSEAFVACDDALEAVVFSALVEVLKKQDRMRDPIQDRTPDQTQDPVQDRAGGQEDPAGHVDP